MTTRHDRRAVPVALALLACLFAAPPAAAQEKGKALKRPHTDSRTPFVHRILLRDEDAPISIPKAAAEGEKAARPKFASLDATCFKCHDNPDRAQRQIPTGWHFNHGDPNVPAGRPGEPWVLTDEGILEDPKNGQAATRTQLPMSYRKWPGTWSPTDVGFGDWKFAYAFGRHLPGGGILETSKDPRFNVTGNLGNDCLVCHVAGNGYNGQVKYEQIFKLQNFKYAPLAAAGVGSAEKGREKLKDTWTPPDPSDPNAAGPAEPPFEYDRARFDAKNLVTFDITRRVANERCYYCHTSMDTGAPQSKDLPQRWRHDRDIHLVKGMLCVDCHRHGLDHMVTRGYEGEEQDRAAWAARKARPATGPATAPAERREPSIATLSCQGCHYGTGTPTAPDLAAVGTDLGGRHGAPRPQHKGLPTLHFEKLSCTACHSGPWPDAAATTVLTSMAHRLGIESFNRSEDAAPTIQQPVFLRDSRTQKITPHKVMYPTFWGRLNGSEVTPITPDVLNTKALRTILGTVNPDVDLQPAAPLTDEKVIKVLDAIAEMKAPAAKESPAPATALATAAATTAPAAAPTPPIYTGEPVFVTGGRAYKRQDGKLAVFDHAAAKPYAWALAHDVRGAQEALGARGCTDCHAAGAPIFDSKLSTASLLIGTTKEQSMSDLRGDDMGALAAFASTYPMRPMLIATGFTCATILFLILLAYAGRAVGAIGRRRAAPPI